MTDLELLAVVAVVTLCTQLTRFAPFLLFGGRRELPGPVRYLGNVLPGAIMAALVVYCLKGTSFSALSGWVPQLAGVGATALLHLWRRSTLLSIAGGTLVYMVLVQAVFA